MDEFNTWTRIVGSLAGELDARMEPPPPARRQHAPRGSTLNRVGDCPSVVALEMSEDCALIICWSDATRGRYAYQRWVIGTSRAKGCCALSGCTIQRGDQVYRPQWRGGYCPANCAEMILAAAIQRMDIRVAESESCDEAPCGKLRFRGGQHQR
ncbi:DUF3331 domain-containing protein [Paraburkholderia oxyphila]|uniref:DUF3331 domain-containing protein n=1 Tax=Paraburkholderia oxyphila TaxID=614212 RepID=UPI000A06DEF3